MAQKRHFLVFEVAPYHFCGPVDQVLGVIMPPRLTKMPLAPFHVAGSFLFRDQVALAIDLRRLFGLEKFTENAGLFIVLQLASGIVGFRVDKVTDVVASSEFSPCDLGLPGLYQLFEKFVFFKQKILLQTDFELLFTADKVADFLPGLEAGLRSAQGEEPEDLPEDQSLLAGGQAEKGPFMIGRDVPDKLWSGSESAESKAVVATGTEEEKKSVRIKVPADSRSSPPVLETELKKVSVRREKKAESAAPFSQRASGRGVFAPSCASQIRPGELDHDYFSAQGSERSGDEGSGGGWWRLGLAGLGLVLLVLVVMFMWPDEVRQGSKSYKRKQVVQEVAVPVKRDIPVKVEDKVLEGRPEVSVTKVMVAPMVETPPEPVLKGSSEMLRVETTDFTLTIERPPTSKRPAPIERQAVPALVQIVAPEKGVDHEVGITHLVVKNDTLWDIADKYLGNPLKYAELARLSRIKDPHWIYPGDIIRIIKKNVSNE
ncbi:MAG: chemotaxis protein CheW [Proteobacteria bacterium]|nr:chemotaxis protein CheW [Pseudomonadota bacterium]MBU1714273.1 chemotaxis protein CheW [Pseudomonadota bacterium]